MRVCKCCYKKPEEYEVDGEIPNYDLNQRGTPEKITQANVFDPNQQQIPIG